MLLDKIYPDYVYRDALERIAVAEGWVTRARDEFGGDAVVLQDRHSNRNLLKGRLLRLLTLFETADTDFTALNWSRLADTGLIVPNSKMLARWRRLVDENIGELPAADVHLRKHSQSAAYELLRASRRRFIRFHVRKSPIGYYSGIRRQRDPSIPNLRELPVHYYAQYWATYTEADLTRNYIGLLDQIFADDEVDEDALKPYALTALGHDILEAKWNLEDCICLSAHERAAFTTDFVGGVSPRSAKPSRSQEGKQLSSSCNAVA